MFHDPLSTCGCLCVPAWTQSSTSLGAVVETKNITFPAGSKAVLPCHSPRMVWTQDRLKDRQRVVHWDMVRTVPEYSVERILDMSPGGRQRVYNGFNKGRVSIPDSAFNDGNFSLVINSEAPPFSRSTENVPLFLLQFNLMTVFLLQMWSRPTEEFTLVICTITTARFTNPFKSRSMSLSQVRPDWC